MNAVLAEPRTWSRCRWLLVVALISVLQTGLIFWLGARGLGHARRTNSGPRVYLPPDQRTELPLATDPTLFVLPNRRGFSGAAWLGVSPLQNTIEEWTEPARPLARPVLDFGASLREFVATNSATPLEVAGKPEPRLDAAELYLPPEPAIAGSTLSLEGQLTGRVLLSELKLKPWPAADVLTNSVVLAAVDRHGGVFSAVLLARSGLKEADEYALSLVKTARFQPWRGGDPLSPGAAPTSLSWGWLVFHWQFIALPATNAVPAPR